jgi:hypothetical protein
MLLVGLPAPALLLGLEPMVDLAFAAPVLAVDFAVLIIFLKKLLFLAFGAPSPPNTPADSIGSIDQSAVVVSSGSIPETWLGWKLGPDPEVSLRIMLRALELTSGVDLVSCMLIGRRF